MQRQYSGTAGRTENCQIGVFAAYATGRGRALVDRELYLPKSWTEDRDRCRAAKIPEDQDFHTKGDLAKALVLRALASDLPIAWVTADSAYGQEGRFRRLLEQSGVGYVLAVPKSQFSVGCPRIDWLFTQAPAEARQRISCEDGAMGPRVYDWAAIQLPAVAEFDCQDETLIRRRWALARRSLSKPDEIAYYLAYTTRHNCRAVGADRRDALGDRRVLPGREERVRPGPVRGPPLHRLDAAHHTGHARPALTR
nr:transposase [Streptomyces sp. 1114.5]